MPSDQTGDAARTNSSNVEIPEDVLNKISTLSLEQKKKIHEDLSNEISKLSLEKKVIKDLSEHKDRIFYLHINVNGLTQKTGNFKKLRNLVEERYENKIDIVCITEPNKPDINVELDDYNRYETFTNGPKGGAAVYVKKSLEKYSKVTRLKSPEKYFKACDHGCGFCSNTLRYETVWIQFKRKRDDKMIVVGTIYRHPDNLADRIECFDNKLKNALNDSEVKGKPFYLLGDFNIDIKNESKSKELLKVLKELGSEQLIPKNKSTTTNGTLIDHIHTNDDPTAANHVVGVDDSNNFKEHYPIYCIK